jgi:hypothetical protein
VSDQPEVDTDAADDLDADRPSGEEAQGSSGKTAANEREETGSSKPSMTIIEARRHAMSVAAELLGDDPESVIRAERTDRGWRVLVEVLERSAVPDTQDILGRYELVIDGDAVVEYGLTERYKRGDSRDEL